ncbi:hypothetical protein ACFSVM_05805 [Paenibacillus shunpengii]|uniref:Uncharacterized protein n=1 Tax=Paenibacillus shunpengii TaxID=2054424 RepID=A0ABW5SL45_9BACL|nr:hypothetical protein [Paenibacillus sp. PDC88]SDW19659.1 hypothetical protein SAMN05518848_101608 [Paenibacillus sp. PDC88]
MSYHIRLRPDLRTSNGEVHDIMVEHQYAGSLILVFREGQRLAGSVQLDAESIPGDAKDEIIAYVQEYVLQFRDAVAAEHFDIMLSWGRVECVLGDEEVYEEYTLDDVMDESSEEGLIEHGAFHTEEPSVFRYEAETGEMQIELISSGRNVSSYELQTGNGYRIAEAVLKQYGTDIKGMVDWLIDPDEEDLETAEELLVSEVNDEEIDTITIDMQFEGQRVALLELEHRDFVELDDEETEEGPDWDEDGMELNMTVHESVNENCYATLIRHDRDILTYELFFKENGGYPAATATVDISDDEISGYIDFNIHPSEEQREQLFLLMARELDKETDVNKLHLTMLYRNAVIDEIELAELD